MDSKTRWWLRRYISNDTLIKNCGYKKPHPLEDKIIFIISINPSHKSVSSLSEVNKIQDIISSLLECIDTIIEDIKILYRVSEKHF